jgi:hypothetical protein
MTVEETYCHAVRNSLYQKISEIGPHGILRELTGMSQARAREMFLDRTPCGICEDLCRDYPDEIRSMLAEEVI